MSADRWADIHLDADERAPFAVDGSRTVDIDTLLPSEKSLFLLGGLAVGVALTGILIALGAW